MKYIDDGVCAALWEAGFCGPESAERGPIMETAKRLVREAYEQGRNDALGITPMQIANQKLCEKGLCTHRNCPNAQLLEPKK